MIVQRPLLTLPALCALSQACKPDLLPAAMHRFVSATLGPSFADPPPARLADVFADSSATTPIVLTVAQGADAMAELGAFAAAQGRAVGRGLQLLSLGQGQGPVAEALVRVAMRNGDWVCLQVRQGGAWGRAWVGRRRTGGGAFVMPVLAEVGGTLCFKGVEHHC